MKVHVIAELSGNHRGDLSLAKEMIKRAKEAGASFVKLQYYEADMLYPKSHPLYEMVKEAQLNVEQIGELKGFAENVVGIALVCTVFVEPKLVGDLESIGLNYYKVREADSGNIKLINRVLQTGKTVFISTRKMPLDMHLLYHPRIKWFYCIPQYPPEAREFELSRVANFDGFSCHFPNIVVPLAAAVMAKAKGREEYYIEVHVTLSHDMEVVDKNVSMDFQELKNLIECIHIIEQFKV